MTYNPEKHHRRSIRLRGYDYSQAGAYFLTLCAWNRENLFGDIVEGEMRLNDAGQIVADEWIKSAAIRREIELDEWMVMPNHLHGIIVITGDHCTGDRPANCTGDRPVAPTVVPTPSGPRPKSIGALMAGFKSASTKNINIMRATPGAPVWQRNYYEHIIRNEESLSRIREYIINNPAQWACDRENTACVRT